MDTIEERKNENLQKTKFHRFMLEVSSQAYKQQVKQSMIHVHSVEMEKRHTYVPHSRKSIMHVAEKVYIRNNTDVPEGP